MNPFSHPHWQQRQRDAAGTAHPHPHPHVQLETRTHQVYQTHPTHPTHFTSSTNPTNSTQHGIAGAPEPPHDLHRELQSALTAALDKMGSNISTRMDMMEIAIGNIARVTDDCLQFSKAARREYKEGFETLQTQILRTAQATTERFTLGLSKREKNNLAADQKSTTILTRLDQLELAIAKLAETDPNTARPSITRHEVAVNTTPHIHPTVDVAVETTDLEPRIPHADMGVQVEQFTSFEGAEALSKAKVASTGPQTVFVPSAHLVSTMSPFYTFVPQPLAPASWSSIDTRSDSTVSRHASETPSPPPWSKAQTSMSSGTAIPSTPPTQLSPQPSSVFDEQEIVNALDVMGQVTSPFRNPQPPPWIPQLLSSPHKAGSSFVPPQAPDENYAKEYGSSSSTIVADSARNSPARPPHSAASETEPYGQNATSPLCSTISVTITPVPLSPVSASHPSSSLSSIHLSNPTSPRLSPRPQPRVAQLRPAQLFPPPQTDASSSLSPPSLHVEIPPAPLPDDRQSLSPISPLTRGSSLSSVSSLSSLSSLSTAPSPAPTHVHPKKRPRQYAPRGGKAGISVSATVRVKSERDDGVPLAYAKRRKTLGTHTELNSASVSKGRGKPLRARGGKATSTGWRKRSQRQLSITPIREPVPPQPAKQSAQQSAQQSKTPYEPPRIGTDCPWPNKVSGEETSRREFVACDACEGWYHFGCVGIVPGDPRLEPDAQFICPPCETSEEIQILRKAIRYKDAACLRPDCDFPGAAEDTNEYFVDRIIGRRPFKPEIDAHICEPTDYMWLVKWYGYKADQATWSANEHLGDCAKIIEEFEQAAEIEGHQPHLCDQEILLNEAAAAGWAGPLFHHSL